MPEEKIPTPRADKARFIRDISGPRASEYKYVSLVHYEVAKKLEEDLYAAEKLIEELRSK